MVAAEFMRTVAMVLKIVMTRAKIIMRLFMALVLLVMVLKSLTMPMPMMCDAGSVGKGSSCSG